MPTRNKVPRVVAARLFRKVPKLWPESAAANKVGVCRHSWNLYHLSIAPAGESREPVVVQLGR